jgi:hypothetical protein
MNAIAELVIELPGKDEWAVMHMGCELPAVPEEGSRFCFPGVRQILGREFLIVQTVVWEVSASGTAATVCLHMDYECDTPSELKECVSGLGSCGWKQKVLVGQEVNEC